MRCCWILLVATGMMLGVVSGPSRAWGAAPTTLPTTQPLKIGKIVYEGGDGSSIEKAVLIKNAADEEAGVAAESAWVRKVHPGWRKGQQSLLMQNNRQYDRIAYATPQGETKTIYFDITEFFGKF